MRAIGSPRTKRNVGTVIPTSHMRASHGAVPLILCESMRAFTNGVSTMPPTDNPDETAAIAGARLAWNQRVTTVVASVSPLDDQATENTP